MTVTMNEPVQTGQLSWLIAWTSTVSNPTFFIYRDGVLILTTEATEYRLTVAAGEAPVIQVLDDATEDPLEAWPARLTIGWNANTDAEHYRIDEFVAAAWVERVQVPEDGSGYYTWRSRVLEDVTTHTFRIMPVDAAGNDGTALSLVCLMVRHPDPPDVTFTYASGTRKVTIAAA